MYREARRRNMTPDVSGKVPTKGQSKAEDEEKMRTQIENRVSAHRNPSMLTSICYLQIADWIVSGADKMPLRNYRFPFVVFFELDLGRVQTPNDAHFTGQIDCQFFSKPWLKCRRGGTLCVVDRIGHPFETAACSVAAAVVLSLVSV